MLGSLAQFLVLAAIIVVAGAGLTVFCEVISKRTRIGGLLAGGILIAGATSLPELAIDISAVRQGSIDLAIGDLVGSNLFNLAILAVLDLTRYSGGQMLSPSSGRNTLAGIVSIALTAVAALFILFESRVDVALFGHIGLGTPALVAGYLLGARLIYREEKHQSADDEGEAAGSDSSHGWAQKLSLKAAVAGYLIAAAAILGAAPFLARAAEDLAERSGLGATFFGTTFVALCTSLPEVVTTFSAVRMKSFDLALGNIFGSNCFNMLILAILDFVQTGSLLAAGALVHAYTAICAILVTVVVIIGQLYRVEKRKPFLEPDAWLALSIVVAALTGLYFVRQ